MHPLRVILAALIILHCQEIERFYDENKTLSKLFYDSFRNNLKLFKRMHHEILDNIILATVSVVHLMKIYFRIKKLL